MIARRALTVALMTAALGVSGFIAAPPPGSQSSDGQNRRVRIHNQTGVTLQKLQAADVRTGTFGGDLLGGTPVASGASTPVTIDAGTGGCLYDLRAELAGGQVLLRENINVCRIADYYLTR
ncbi:hypothetical protein GCM10009116_19810 [Brevundimonas basaltis]|uniref:Tat pathway signal sequence domain protein n=1 Tax=Brevundimonas basaltis TaxID=472166 RepID=A0A7W8MG03_9CAUL|nr:hypothetical protein [Brevundimonas basaltis]MBB5291733.1 hypothetical protein [Brevundimonas basaltis]